MASNPPLFQVEDQTDEDFFDKLVEDDDFVPDKVVTPPKVSGFGNGLESEDSKLGLGVENESDETKMFADFHKVGLGPNDGADESEVFAGLGEVGLSLNDGAVESIVFGDSNDVGLGPNVGADESELFSGLDKVGSDESKVFGGLTGIGSGSIDECNEALASANLSIDGNVCEQSKDIVNDVGLEGGSEEESGNEASSGLVGNWSVNGVTDYVNEVSSGGEKGLGVNKVNDNGVGSEVEGDSREGNYDGNGVKEVGWNLLFADSGQNDAGDFGSEFFMGIGGSSGAGDFSGGVDGNVAGGMDYVVGKEEQKTDSFGGLSYAQYFEGHAYSESADIINDRQDMYVSQYSEQAYALSFDSSNDQQDTNSSQYWESLYPGWKYDSNTGQWYQLDAQDSTANIQGIHDATTSGSEWDAVPEQKSEISYLQQTVQPVTVAASEDGANENVISWNQAPQANNEWENAQLNNGYPEHMLFYPEYPGWYFDRIAQEWHTLENYTSSIPLTGQTHDQQENDGPNNSFSSYNDNSYSECGQTENFGSPAISSQGQGSSWTGSFESSTHHTTARTEPVSSFGRNQLANSTYSLMTSLSNQAGYKNSNSFGAMPSNGDINSQTHANGSAFPKFVPSRDFSQPLSVSRVDQNNGSHFSNGLYGSGELTNSNQQSFQSGQQFPFVSSMERSSAGRPPHALVTFGFAGKLVIFKNNSSFSNSSYGSQDVLGGFISVHNLEEVVKERTDASGVGVGSCGYFNALCKESFPGPLVGGNVGTKELYKWIDEKIANSESSDVDSSKGRILKLLFSLLKIACQHYGKLRSPFGTDTTMRESDAPETAVAKLFAYAKNSEQLNHYDALNQCVQNMPSEAQIQATASNVQNLLVSGRKQEALQCAQEGQLWGTALIIASLLGNQFYVDAVKQMALRQLVAGSPLRTLCLLIAGQPAEVFSTDTTGTNVSTAMDFSQPQAQYGDNVMLDDWQENLAVITANRTKDDELVIIHLGDCLWKERSNIVAAHICYLVAEANFEKHSDTARLCLVGADHWKYPRTYASPEAIQRTELYEYSKVLGNSQFILLPFQPYKLIYAHMLAEVGRVSDSLKYCQAVLKSLKTGRAPEVETWKQLVLSLEERIRAHQQGGYTGNLAPKKIVGKLLNFFDSTAQKVVGGIPPPAPSAAPGNVQGNELYTQPMGNRVSTSQSTMAMSSLIPSASMERISEWPSDGNRRTMQNRSVSEPDFSRNPGQDDSSLVKQSSDAQGKPSGSSGASRFSRFGFGSQILQRTVGLVLRPRPGRQAKLGEENKFYYNEKLKMWVEEGAEPPAEEAALPPPPTTAPFQNGMSNFNMPTLNGPKNDLVPPYSSPEYRSPAPTDHSSGIPPLAPSSNQFSARGRMGVRSRYVDTFNKGRGSAANSFLSASVPSIKPTVASNANFFIPTPAAPAEQTTEAMAENKQENNVTSNSPLTYTADDPVQHCTLSPPVVAMQRFPSMDNISRKEQSMSGSGPLLSHSRRTASWSGSLGDAYDHKSAESKLQNEALGMSLLAFSQDKQTSLHKPSNSGSIADDLQEVDF